MGKLAFLCCMRFLISLILLLVAAELSAGNEKLPVEEDKNPLQNILPPKGLWFFELGSNLSRIIPHRSYFLAEVNQFSFIFDAEVSRRVSGKKDWHHKFHLPELGAMFSYLRLGNADVFGSAAGVVPFFKYNWVKNRGQKWFVKVGFGLGYVSKRYDPVENPTNEAISTPFNNYSKLELGVTHRLGSRYHLTTAVSASHFSNANIKQPNLGLNLLSAKLAIGWAAGKQTEIRREVEAELPKRWAFYLRPSWGMTTGDIDGQPADHVISISAYVARTFKHQHRVQLGLNYEHLWPIRNYLVEQGSEDLNQAGKVWLHLGYEYLMDQLGFVVQAGVYLYDPVVSRPSMANRFGFNYYPAGTYGKKKTFYLGAYLKSHSARADYPEFALGFSF